MKDTRQIEQILCELDTYDDQSTAESEEEREKQLTIDYFKGGL